MITQAKIAEDLKLSKKTVSRYFTDSSLLGDETTRRIKEYIELSGYSPNLAARGLVLQRSSTIGLIVPAVNFSYYPKIIENIRLNLKKCGYNILLGISYEDPQEEKNELDTLISVPVAGIILCPSSNSKSQANCEYLEKRGIPFVLFDRYFPEKDFASVSTDASAGARELVRLLLDKGCRRVAHIGGPEGNSFAREVFDGFKNALKDHKITADHDMIFHDSICQETGRKYLHELVSKKRNFDAVQAVNDQVALGVIVAARELKLKIPEDFSLVGFSDLDISQIVDPPLTSFREPIEKMAASVSEIITSLIEKTECVRQIKLQGTVIRRSSA